jgi:hypothetical protein
VIPRFVAASVNERPVDVHVSQGFMSRWSGRYSPLFIEASCWLFRRRCNVASATLESLAMFGGRALRAMERSAREQHDR